MKNKLLLSFIFVGLGYSDTVRAINKVNTAIFDQLSKTSLNSSADNERLTLSLPFNTTPYTVARDKKDIYSIGYGVPLALTAGAISALWLQGKTITYNSFALGVASLGIIGSGYKLSHWLYSKTQAGKWNALIAEAQKLNTNKVIEYALETDCIDAIVAQIENKVAGTSECQYLIACYTIHKAIHLLENELVENKKDSFDNYEETLKKLKLLHNKLIKDVKKFTTDCTKNKTLQNYVQRMKNPVV